MEALQDSMMDRFRMMLVEQLNKPSGSIAPNPTNNTIVTTPMVTDALKETPASTEYSDADPRGTKSSGYNAYPPPPSYHSPNFYPMPHINSHGPPPKLDKSNFVNWQTLMKSHICSASTQLWRSVKLGFHPREPNNLTSRGEVEEQLNGTALHIIQQAVPDTYIAHIRTLATAKQACDYLESLFTGNASIKSSKFDEMNSEQENLIMIAGETPEDMHRRLTALSVALTDHGCKDTDDKWIKRKFISAIMPREPIHTKIICSRADFASMSSDDFLSEFISLTILKKNAKATLARALAIKGGDGPNLAFNAKVEEDTKSEEEVEMIDWAPEDVKYAYHEHMALATKAFWTGRNKNFKSRDNSRGASRPSGPKVRNCYNCGDKNHFITECPYEKREENGGWLVRKDRSKFPPTNTSRIRTTSITRRYQQGCWLFMKNMSPVEMMIMTTSQVKKREWLPLPLLPLPLSRSLVLQMRTSPPPSTSVSWQRPPRYHPDPLLNHSLLPLMMLMASKSNLR
jgi:hypothetical protein